MKIKHGPLTKLSTIFLLVLAFVGEITGAWAQTASAKTNARRANPKIEQLQKQLKHTEQRVEDLENKLNEFEKQANARPSPATIVSPEEIFSTTTTIPTGPIPTYWSVPNSSNPSDIPCAPKLAFYAPADKWTPFPDSSASQYKFDPTLPPSTVQQFDTKFERPPIHAYISQPASLDQNLNSAYCNPLSRITRLFLENAAVGANWGYTNIAGSGNVAANVPITQTAGTTYQVGIGYSQKPILKQIRAVLRELQGDRDPDGFEEAGRIEEDFFFNAVTMSAGFSYGKTLTVKNEGSVVETLNSRPSYSATLTYSLPLESIWSHIVHPDARVAGPGYYFKAPCPDFWGGTSCANAPDAVNAISGVKTP